MAWDWILKNYLGFISQEEKDGVYERVKAECHPSNEFFIMLVISAVIATIGLLTNSVAVIIGAMLVSPLLTPVIGMSLGAVKGDFALFRTALEAEAKGALLVIGLVAALTLVVPNASITSEILLRTHPTPLDLLVALASGAAAAYALSKKNISATLPGVAIAVAVLPPLSVAGIGFALREPAIALGGALTFLANIVAINFAASAVFWLMEFAPKWSLKGKDEAASKIKTSAVLLLIILLPLAWIMWDSLSTADKQAKIGQVLSQQIEGIEGARLSESGFSYGRDGALLVTASIDSPKEITQEKAGEMKFALEKKLDAKVELLLTVNEVRLVRQ